MRLTLLAFYHKHRCMTNLRKDAFFGVIFIYKYINFNFNIGFKKSVLYRMT